MTTFNFTKTKVEWKDEKINHMTKKDNKLTKMIS